jgi:hypothetical protein
MGRLFNRAYRLLIIPDGGGQATEITDLRISFAVEKSDQPESNTATISVYNMSPDTREKLAAPGVSVSLEAGYGDEIGIVSVGNDLIIESKLDNVDRVTEIKTRDGGKQTRETVAVQEVPEGEPLVDTIKGLVGKFNDVTGLGVELDALPSTPAPKPKVIAKPAADALTEILRSIEYDWSIIDNEFRVVKKGQTSQETVVLISPRSGLIDSPAQTENGVTFRCLLSAKLKPFRAVQLESDEFNGLYRMNRVRFVGDSWQGDWICEVEAEAL